MLKEVNNGKNISKWKYHVICEEGYNIDLGQFNTYGIQLTGPDFEKVLHDVSVCEETVKRITKLFNKHQLFPCHFQDAVEDLLQ